MKEGLVTLPEGVVILEGHLEDKKSLPLSVIPDSEADKINRGIAFVLKQRDRGILSASAFHSFFVILEKRLEKVVSYRVVLKK